MFRPEVGALVAPEKQKLERRKPINVPDVGEDDLVNWHCGIKQEAPFEYRTVATTQGSISFQKKNLPSDHSYASNLRKSYFAHLPIIALTEKQVEAIKKGARKITWMVGERYDWARSTESGQPVKLPPVKVCLADWIILEKDGEYNPQKHLYREAQEEQEVNTEQEFKDELHTQQTSSKKSKK